MEGTATWPRKTREVQTRIYDSTMWNDFRIREDDIIVATYPKAGTTWTQQVVLQLVFNGDPAIDVMETSLWLDLRVEDRDARLQELEAQTHRRLIKSHLPADALVVFPSARYIYVARDGRDVAWSLHNHWAGFTPAFREGRNALPLADAPLIVPPPADIREFWRDWLDRDGYPDTPFWEHVRSWWAIRDLPNVRLVHYANLKRDLPGEIRQIAAFLDIPIDESRWNAILEHCSIDWMRANSFQGAGQVFDGGANTFFYRGVNGRWSETLTPDEIVEYEARAVHELGEDCAYWLATGELV